MHRLALSLLAAATTAGLVGTPGFSAPARPPNQIFILLDDVARDWVGAYGASNPTPHFDRLAKEGVRFTTAWCTPVCTPTRVALLTGQYPYRSGWTVHYDVPRWGGKGLDPDRFETIGSLLHRAGYATAIAGKWQINDLRDDPRMMQWFGFDEHCLWTGVEQGNPASEKRYWDAFLQTNGERRTHAGKFGPDVVQAFALDFVRRNRDRPFFLYYPMIEAHALNEPTPHNRANAPNGEAALFADMVKYADYQVGQLLDVLDELGLRENTIVYLMGDNGSSTGGTLDGKAIPSGKAMVSDLGVHVPLIVRAPGIARAGRVSSALADSTDLLPTMMELAGQALPQATIFDGRSLVKSLKGVVEPNAERKWIFTQYGRRRAVRDQQYFYDSSGAIFDLVADPLQEHNLILSKAEEVSNARARLHDALAARPDDAGPPFPGYENADRFLNEFMAKSRDEQKARAVGK